MYLRQKPSPLQVYIGKTTQSVRNRWFKQDAADLRREAQTPHWEKVNEILNHRGNMDAMEELNVQLVHCYLALSMLRGYDMALFVVRQCKDEESLRSFEGKLINEHYTKYMLHGLNCKKEPYDESQLSASVKNYTCY